MTAFNEQQLIVIGRIAKTSDTLEDELGLNGFLQIKHIYDAGMDGDHASSLDEANLFGTCAITTPNWHYSAATIRWFLPTTALLTDNELEQVAVHEYVHILVHPITQLITSAKDLGIREEFATERIARMVCHARGMKNVH